MSIRTEPSPTIIEHDGTPLVIVPGDEAARALRGPINDLLRPLGLAMRFFWYGPEGQPEAMRVQAPPYAFFCKRSDLDDRTEAEAAARPNGSTRAIGDDDANG